MNGLRREKMTDCIESALIEDPYFRQDKFGSYLYDEDTNEVTLWIHKPVCRFEASVLIEMLASFIIDISQVQSLGKVVDK